MAKFGRGLICLAMTEARCDALALAPITPRNTSMFGTPFCEPIDARVGTTTGTSASDRAVTILAATNPNTRPEDLARPGHVYTLRARNGGVLVRAGQTEASVDLARLAGLDHSGVICEVMNDDGSMARIPQLIEFCKLHGMKLLTVADLIRYRMQHERHIRRIAESTLPTRHGNFQMIAYASEADHEIHVALVRGDVSQGAEADDKNGPPLVRVHSHCLTGDVFGSTACDCHDIVEASLAAINQANRGVFVICITLAAAFRLSRAIRNRASCRAFCSTIASRLTATWTASVLVQRESGNRRPDSDRPGAEAYPRAHQPSAEGRSFGWLRREDRGPGPAEHPDLESSHQVIWKR